MGRKLVGKGAPPRAVRGPALAATGLSALALPVGGVARPGTTARPLIAVVILGIFGTGFTFALNYRLIADEGATSAATVGYLLPVVSVGLGAIVLDEELGVRVVAGMAGRAGRRRPDPVAAAGAGGRSPSGVPGRTGGRGEGLSRGGRCAATRRRTERATPVGMSALSGGWSGSPRPFGCHPLVTDPTRIVTTTVQHMKRSDKMFLGRITVLAAIIAVLGTLDGYGITGWVFAPVVVALAVGLLFGTRIRTTLVRTVPRGWLLPRPTGAWPLPHVYSEHGREVLDAADRDPALEADIAEHAAALTADFTERLGRCDHRGPLLDQYRLLGYLESQATGTRNAATEPGAVIAWTSRYSWPRVRFAAICQLAIRAGALQPATGKLLVR